MFLAFVGRVVKKLLSSYQYAIYQGYRRKYELDESFRFNGPNICFFGKGKIIIGKDSYLGEGSSIQSDIGCVVSIGSSCSISHNVRIYTCNLDADQVISGNKSEDYLKKANVSIGASCWIGANVFIKEGVNIGNHCVVAANSLVTRDVPDHSVVMGVPAKVVKYYQPETGQISKGEKL